MKIDTQIEKSFHKYTPFIISGVISLILCIITEWHSDATYYQYIVPIDPDTYPEKRINSLSDIIISQSNHYLNTNGRFFVHFLVQLFCGILGKYIFALFNAIVWFLLPIACLRINYGNHYSIKQSIFTTTMILLLLLPLRFDPAFQINYSWMSLMFCGWILTFFRKEDKKKWLWLIFIGIYSFLFGEGNESFSIPVGGAIIMYAIIKKFRLTTTQWVSSISFGIGAITLIIAPGNWVRFDAVISNSPGLANLESVLPGLFFPSAYLISKVALRKKTSSSSKTINILLLTIALINYLFCLYLGGGSGFRMLVSGNLCFILLTIPIIADSKAANTFNATACFICSIVLAFISIGILKMRSDDKLIYEGYDKSVDGIVYLPDDIFISRAYQFIDSYSTYQAEARYRHPGKQYLRIRPESMKSMPLDKDTNMIVRLSENAWLLMQSKTAPSDFIVKKNLLPGLLNKKMGDRKLDFLRKYDIAFDSTENSRMAVYINTRPLIIKADVFMRRQDD